MKLMLLIILMSMSSFLYANQNDSTSHFIRYLHEEVEQFGKIEGDYIQPMTGELFGVKQKDGQLIKLADVTPLLPSKPQKVFAVGMNFASHMSSPSNQPPPLFLKLPSSLITSNQNINLTSDAKNVHFEGELVLIIGKQAKDVSLSQAKDVIFGVTVGNDITERSWQSQDLQWMRAKASDGFGPIGSVIATNVDYENVLLTTKLNGKIVQQENTKYMIHSPAKVVSYLSQYFTLMPGDLIYMGTPGRTQALKHNDVISVSIEGVDSITNTIKRMGKN